MKSSSSKLFSLLVVFCLLFLVAESVHAQTGTSSIGGTITDPQGRPVASAKVTVTNLATNATRSMQSTDTGAYLFALITPGAYRLEVEAKGFNKTVFDNVQALIGKQTESNVELNIGAVSTVVEVSVRAQDALVNTQDASLGNVFVSGQIAQLPAGCHARRLRHGSARRSVERYSGRSGY